MTADRERFFYTIIDESGVAVEPGSVAERQRVNAAKRPTSEVHYRHPHHDAPFLTLRQYGGSTNIPSLHSVTKPLAAYLLDTLGPWALALGDQLHSCPQSMRNVARFFCNMAPVRLYPENLLEQYKF